MIGYDSIEMEAQSETANDIGDSMRCPSADSSSLARQASEHTAAQVGPMVQNSKTVKVVRRPFSVLRFGPHSKI